MYRTRKRQHSKIDTESQKECKERSNKNYYKVMRSGPEQTQENKKKKNTFYPFQFL